MVEIGSMVEENKHADGETDGLKDRRRCYPYLLMWVLVNMQKRMKYRKATGSNSGREHFE